VIKNEKVALDRLRVRQNVFLVKLTSRRCVGCRPISAYCCGFARFILSLVRGHLVRDVRAGRRRFISASLSHQLRATDVILQHLAVGLVYIDNWQQVGLTYVQLSRIKRMMMI